MTNNQFYSKRTQAYMKSKTFKHKGVNLAKSLLWLMVPCVLVGIVVLDWLRVVRLSWLF